MAKVRFITPKGVANYPWLNAPDFEYNSDGEYKEELKTIVLKYEKGAIFSWTSISL